MNDLKIKITGNGTTFGAITRSLEFLFKEIGADVELVLDHETAIIPLEEVESHVGQIRGRKIVIETESLPWGG